MATKEDRTCLIGLEMRRLKLMCNMASSKQWAEWLRPPLEHALADGDKDLSLALLKAGADGKADWVGDDDRNLLHAAAEGGNEELVSTMLEAGGSEHLSVASGARNRTALHRALAGGHTEAARVLMLAGADASLLDSRLSALHYAVEGRHLQLAGDAMIGGANPKQEDVNGNTPLHLAAAHGDEKFVSALLCRGASATASNNEGKSPLHVAVEGRRVGVAELLLKAGADPNVRCGSKRVKSPLFCGRHDEATTRMLPKYGAEAGASDDLGFTALHWAAARERPRYMPLFGGDLRVGVIDALVEAGANLEAPSRGVRVFDVHSFGGLTPLHVATYSRKRTTIAANIHARTDEGYTALHVLCKTANTKTAYTVEIADALLRWGADETATDDNDRAPKDLVVGDSKTRIALLQVLANAPAGRAWCRRGMLVMCRAFPEKIMSGGQKGRAGRAKPRTGPGRGRGRGRGGGRVNRAHGIRNLLTGVVELEDDEIFRAIIGYL